MFVNIVQVYCHHLRDSASIGSFNFALIAIFVPTALPGYVFKTMTGFVSVLLDSVALFPLEFCPFGRKDGTKAYSEWNEGLHYNSVKKHFKAFCPPIWSCRLPPSHYAGAVNEFTHILQRVERGRFHGH